MKILLHRTDAGRKRNGPVSAYQIVYKEAKLVYLFQRVQNSILFIRKSFYAKFSMERFEKKCFNLCPSICPINCPIYFASARTECPFPDISPHQNLHIVNYVTIWYFYPAISLLQKIFLYRNNHRNIYRFQIILKFTIIHLYHIFKP